MDNNATTPLDPRVLDEMMPFLTKEFGNPSSTDHQYGLKALKAVDNARERLAKLINANPEEIILTGGATESDNLALQGVARAYSTKGRHIITCSTEHKAVLDTCRFLQTAGWSITYLPVDEHGVVDLEALESSITKETVLISVMFANNEIGTVAPMTEIGRIAKEHEIFFHSDAAQAAGHVPIDVDEIGLHMMSISAHKCYGPKGIGALYVRGHNPRIRPAPLIFGGGQERGLRSGTLNVPAIVGMGKTFEIARKEMGLEAQRLFSLTERMRQSFELNFNASLNGHPTNRLPHNLNMFFPGIESKAMIQSVEKEVAISASSACTTQEVEPSHVILALGFDANRAHGSVRFGLGRFNTDEEVDYATSAVSGVARRLLNIRSFETFPQQA